uniref:SF1B family DNA helicase RecD2 n=1 Tax=Eubacterium sp. TaxID=142586 RepID=UPI004026CCAE
MAEKKLEPIKGTVEEITFYNQDNGYTVMEISCGNEAVTVVGNFSQLAVGSQIEASGEWTVHPSYGRQFKADTLTETLPQDAAGILRYLSSGIIKGVGRATAEKIVNAFGSESFDVIEKDVDRLSSIKGISKPAARKIQRSFIEKFASRQTIEDLKQKGLTHKEAFDAYNFFHENAVEVFDDNPYDFVAAGIYDFDRAEEIAEELDEPVSPGLRAQSLVEHIVDHNISNGHTCLPRDSVVRTAKTYLSCSDDVAQIAVDDAVEYHRLITEDIDGRQFLFTPSAYNAEKDIADRIKVFVNYPPQESEISGAEIYAFEKANDIEFDAKQRKAIEIAVNKGSLILTGGPGTGKTTTVKGIIALMQNRGLDVALAAPTGRAAKRMTELTGCEAKTVHRLLEVEYKDGSDKPVFVHNHKNPLDVDAVIVDELSMVDIFLFDALLDALPLRARLIMVGDKDQLPPVGAGNVLSDMIKSGLIPVVELDKIFRQAMQSLIVTNAHRVVKGEMPVTTDNGVDSDFFMMHETVPISACRKIVDLVTRRLPAAYSMDPVSDLQVLCPSKIGETGSQNINIMLQKQLNPPERGKNEIVSRGYILREGDKVMQIKNNYDIPWFKSDDNGMGVFNGDIGILTRIDRAADIINVKFDDREAMYSVENVGELELAYAMTVHKSQGSEFDGVIIPVVATPQKLAYRNLFYTAVTRAKKLIVLVGTESNVRAMVENDKKSRRYSALLHFLTVDNNPFLQ